MAGELERFNSTLVYEAQAPAEQLQADLQQIREFDKRAEEKTRRYKYITFGSLLFGIGSFVLVIALNKVGLLALVGVAVFGLITGIVLWVRGAKFNLANRRYELFGELARLLGRDMAKDAALTVALDMTPPNDARKKVNEGQAGDWKVKYFVDPWLKLGGRFADGTSFQITLIEKFQARGKWKRSRSGKNKYKTKTKSSTQAAVRLFPKLKRYENLPQVTDKAASLLRLPEWVTVKNMDATADELSLTACTTEAWSVRRHDPKTTHDGVEMVATMLLSLYQVLHSANALSEK